MKGSPKTSMRPGLRHAPLPFLLLLLATEAFSRVCAQVAEPEVRRALPAGTPLPDDLIPVRRALPAGPSSRETPFPSPPPTPRATTSGTVSRPSTAAPAVPEASRNPDSSGPETLPPSRESIRIAPSDPAAEAAAQLAEADGLYSRKQAEQAVPAYEKYLVMVPSSDPAREKALYRLGECQRQMGSKAAAEVSFQTLLKNFPGGKFVPASSYRLGELLESDGDHAAAAECFAVTAKGASDPLIRLAAKHNGALCLEQAGQSAEAERLFAEVADSPSGSENPYRIPSILGLAAAACRANDHARALALYRRVLDLKPSGDLLHDTAIKAARIEADQGHTGEAAKLYRQVAEAPDSGRWKAPASLALLRLAANGSDDAGILKACNLALASDRENTPEILLIRANSLRRTGNPRQALADYERILREFPGSKASADAPFQRLVALNLLGSPTLDTEIDSFLATATDPGQRARARLLKAETTLRAGHYKEAAALYHDLPEADLPPSQIPDIRYKEAWANLQSGDRNAGIAGLGRFLEKFPKDDRAPAALAQQAILHQQGKEFDQALADFTLLADAYPKAPERELALQQKALLLGQLQRNPEMVATFRDLLRDYPSSKAAPQAHYWIGWAALGGKDYAGALSDLQAAREGNPKDFGERAGLRLLLCHYSLDQGAEAEKEAMKLKPSLIPPEVAAWLGQSAMKQGSPEKAERFLLPLVKQGGSAAQDPAILRTLATALISEGKQKEALPVATACLKLSRDPSERAAALLATAAIHRSLGEGKEASAQVEEAMLLQPEGPLNALARILSGDLLSDRKDHLGAAKAYMTVAVLSDDPVLTPKALILAAEAYGRAGNLLEARKAIDELHGRFPNAPAPKIPST